MGPNKHVPRKHVQHPREMSQHFKNVIKNAVRVKESTITNMMEETKQVLETSDFFSADHLNYMCPTFWGTEADGKIVTEKVLSNIHPTLKRQWNKLECYCGFTPSLILVKKAFVILVYLTCGSVFPTEQTCNFRHSISRPLVKDVQKAVKECNKPSSTQSSMSEEQDLVAPLNANNPFAVSARAQQRERNMMKKATFNPWGNPDPEEDAPYLAVTEDGYVITQEGCYEKYQGPHKTRITSPRFKQLYKYHKKQPMVRSTPVMEQWLEQRYGAFLLPLKPMRRQLLVNYHNTIKRAMDAKFSLEVMEKNDGDRIKSKQTHRFDQLSAFYRKQKWQVDMPVTEEWLEKHYGKQVPQDTFCLSERYKQLLDLQEEVKTYQEWLERTIGCLVPRSLPGKSLHHLIECYHYNKHLSLTDTALERTYGPVFPQEEDTVVTKTGETAECVTQEYNAPPSKKRKNTDIVYF